MLPIWVVWKYRFRHSRLKPIKIFDFGGSSLKRTTTGKCLDGNRTCHYTYRTPYRISFVPYLGPFHCHVRNDPHIWSLYQIDDQDARKISNLFSYLFGCNFRLYLSWIATFPRNWAIFDVWVWNYARFCFNGRQFQSENLRGARWDDWLNRHSFLSPRYDYRRRHSSQPSRCSDVG